jgi:hypothetical protein
VAVRLGISLTSAIAIRRDIYVGESDEEADETARNIIEKGYRGFSPEALTIGGIDKVYALSGVMRRPVTQT